MEKDNAQTKNAPFMMYQPELKFKEKLQTRQNTRYIILHHSEVTSPHSVEDVHQWHLNKGWTGIGYHYFIRKNGDIFTGRPLDTVGAHTLGHNRDSIGICFEGDFNKEMLSEKQLNASIMLLLLLTTTYENAELCTQQRFNPRKKCPGSNFPFDLIRQRVESSKENH